jgi:hypothetical protein
MMVNASAGFSKDFRGCVSVSGPVWRSWVAARSIIPLENQGKTEAAEAYLRESLLYEYCPDVKCYRCTAMPSQYVLGYSIVDAMFGAATWNSPACGGDGGDFGEALRYLWEIQRPAERFVFVDQGWATIDSYTVYYNQPKWWEAPPGQHDMGGLFSFADMHVEYRKWEDERTIELVRYYEETGSWPPSSEQPCNADLEWVQVHAWGELGYDPADYGCE